MSTNKLLVTAAIVTTIGASMGLLAAAVSFIGNGNAVAMDQAPLAHVDVAPVLVKRIRHWDEFNGRISAVEFVEIRSRVSGYVTRVDYKEGDEVRRGDLLFAIDPRPYQAVLNSAAAQLERARATALLAKGRDLRARKLLPSSAVSQDEADARHATHAQSEADVLNAEAAVDIAQLNLGFTEVRAPIDGRAGRAMLTAGNCRVGSDLADHDGFTGSGLRRFRSGRAKLSPLQRKRAPGSWQHADSARCARRRGELCAHGNGRLSRPPGRLGDCGRSHPCRYVRAAPSVPPAGGG